MTSGKLRTSYEYGKKITTTGLLSALLVLTPMTGFLGSIFGGTAAAATNIISDGFESGFASWALVGGYWGTTDIDASEGDYSAYLVGNPANAGKFISLHIDTTGYSNVTASFDYKRLGMDADDIAQISTHPLGNAGAATVTNIPGDDTTLDDDTTWVSGLHNFGAANANQSTVVLTIGGGAVHFTDIDDQFFVDNLVVSGESIVGPVDTTDPSSSILTPDNDAVVLTGESITSFTSQVSDDTTASENLTVSHSFNPDRPGLPTFTKNILTPSASGANTTSFSGDTLATETNMIPGDTFSWIVTVFDEAENVSLDTKYDLVFTDPVARNAEDDIFFATVQEAIDAATTGTNETIELLSDITVDEQITISKDILFEGNERTIHGAFTKTTNANNAIIGVIGTDGVTIQNLILDGMSGVSLHGINFYEASHSMISNVTVTDNDNAGVIVNGSNVIAENLTTDSNGWYGVGIDQGSGVTNPATFTAWNTSSHNEAFHVVIDDKTKDVQFNDDDNQYELIYDADNTQVFNLRTAEPEACIPTSTFDDFTLGSVNGQFGWSSTGPYDQEIVDNIYGYTVFGCKSLRISNANTSGSFGDQTFSNSVANEAGETTAENNGLSGGERKDTFTAQWSFASTTPGEYQPNLQITASPDRGDGARMSYIQMADLADGLAVNFYDFQDGEFVFTQIVSELDRTTPHTITVILNFVDGPSNDIVKVFVDGILLHTGTSWEDYFREVEENETRTVDSILFRAGGTAAPGSLNKGFLIDNLTITTSNAAVTTPSTPTTPTTPVAPASPLSPSSVIASLVGNSQAENGVVLAANTDTTSPSDETESNDEDSDVLATNTDEVDDNSDEMTSCFKIFGICWYWWIIPLVAILLYLYYRARKESDES